MDNSHFTWSFALNVVLKDANGRTRLEVQFQGETAWLTQPQVAELFQTTIPNVSTRIRNVFAEGELQADSVVKEFLTTAPDEKTEPAHVEKDFEAAVQELKKLPTPSRKKSKP